MIVGNSGNNFPPRAKVSFTHNMLYREFTRERYEIEPSIGNKYKLLYSLWIVLERGGSRGVAVRKKNGIR